MTLETVKATYDPQARAIYVKLSEKREEDSKDCTDRADINLL